MNFYPFNIGDYAGKTRHLTWDEDMAYRRLLDVYYSTEVPLPADRNRIHRLAGAQTTKQKQAVDAVLGEFFDLHSDGYRNARCDEEITKTAAKKAKAQQSAAMRWNGTAHNEGNANASPDAMRTHSEGNAPNPNPNPKRIDEVVAQARDPDTELERKLRAAAGWQNEPSPKLAVTGPIQALLDNGADLDLDVLPVIQAIAPQADGRSWNYFVKAIARARDQRIAAATVVSMPIQPRSFPHGQHRSKPSRDETFAAIDRSIDELERRSGAASGGKGGFSGFDEGAA
jgi:uncharacterized protein YdaU (DUF1376 family)